MIQVIDAGAGRHDIAQFLEDYVQAVRSFGEEVHPSWLTEKLASIQNGEEHCLGALTDERLDGILCFRSRNGRAQAFVCWKADAADGEALSLLIEEYIRRSPKDMMLRISGIHPHIRQGLMFTVCDRLGFSIKRRFEMMAPLDKKLESMRASCAYTTAPMTDFNSSALSELDWEGYRNTVDQALLFSSKDDNTRLLQSLLQGDYGPVIGNASICVVRHGKPAAMIAVTDAGRSAFLADIVVAEELRGQGVGRYLLVEAMKAAKRLEKKGMVLWVTEGNERAIALYSSLGFVTTRTGVYYLRSTGARGASASG